MAGSNDSVLPIPALKALLYGGAPFFCWPYKPALNAIAGQSYSRAYVHFRRDHQNPWNLFYHCLCLCFQLGGNYGLLEVAGREITKFDGGENIGELLPAATTAVWGWTLLRSREAPLIVRVLAVTALGVAHTCRKHLADRWRSLMWFTAVLEMMAVQVFVINKAKDSKGKGRKPFSLSQLVGMVTVRLGIQKVAEQFIAGKLAGGTGRKVVNGLLALWMLRGSQDPFGVKSGGVLASPFSFGLYGWIISLLTDQPWIYFYSTGFLSSLAQGVAHHYAQEEGTLPQLGNIGDEFAHTTFFPNVLLHSVYQSLKSGRGPAEL